MKAGVTPRPCWAGRAAAWSGPLVSVDVGAAWLRGALATLAVLLGSPARPIDAGEHLVEDACLGVIWNHRVQRGSQQSGLLPSNGRLGPIIHACHSDPSPTLTPAAPESNK